MHDLPEMLRQNAELRGRLEELEEVLDAVRGGKVDALVTGGAGKRGVFSLQGVETPYRVFVEAMQEGAATVDAGGCITYANGALARLLGRQLKNLIGSLAREMVVPAERKAFEALLQAGQAADTQRAMDLLAADCERVSVHVAAGALGAKGGAVALVISDLRAQERGAQALLLLDQSERMRRALLSVLEDRTRAESTLRKTNRALRTLSACNEALVRATDEAGLLREMVRVLHEIGGYPVAFIGYPLDDVEQSIEPKAVIGFDPGTLASAISWGDNERGQSATGRALRLGKTQVLRDVPEAARHASWQADMEACGVRDALRLPLRRAPDELPFGVLGLGSSETQAFDVDEVKLLEELAGDLAYGIVNLRTAAARRESVANLRRSLEGTIGAMGATMESRDPYTAGHQHRVAVLAVAIATEMGLPPDMVEGVHFGALVHDLGKIQVPAEILAKPSRLSKPEFDLIKTHPQAGYEIIKGVEFPWPIARMVLEHHERLDGSGYPQGLKGEAIALEARILAVADVVEAMSSHRPYRPGLGIDVALAEIERLRGIQLEPDAVDACVRLFREKRFAFAKA